MIYAWLTDGATSESIDKFNASLNEPEPGSTQDSQGWTDEETFDSFEAFTSTMSTSRSRLGAAK